MLALSVLRIWHARAYDVPLFSVFNVRLCVQGRKILFFGFQQNLMSYKWNEIQLPHFSFRSFNVNL